jgi:hypothetical protein
MYLYNTEQYENIPERIRLADGSTRTSLHELTKPEQEALGLVEYTNITPEYDPEVQRPTTQYTLDHENKTATFVLENISEEEIKAGKLSQLYQAQALVQAAGFTCTNNIKLQVMEQDLARWTQLMVGLTAFAPPTVTIRDYDNINHTITLAEATQMLMEVFAWGQWFLADTWTKKDAITSGL